MAREIRPAIVILLALTLITGLVYPLAITGIAGILFPHQAQGSLVRQGDTVVGSALIGQPFASERYFHGRPSATTAPDPADATKSVPAPYNAANSGGSNLGPSNKALIDRVQGDIAALKKENASDPVPPDLVTSSGAVPRGVTVAGQEIGGLSRADAEQRVRTAVEPRTTQPVAVAVGDVTSEIEPKAAGLSVDWPGTIDRAGTQPWNPITRVRSFFTTREVGVATLVDEEALDSALQQLAPVVDKPPVEGTVRFEGVTPVPVPPVDGQSLDLAVAKQTLERDWTSGQRVELPITVLHPVTSQDDVTKALTDIATDPG